MEYIVQENETIADIARKTGADPQEIIFLNYLDESTPIQAGDFLEVPGEAGRMKMNRFQVGGEVEQVQTKKPSPDPTLPIMGQRAIPDSGMKDKNFIQNAPTPSVGKMPAGAMQSQKRSAKNIGRRYSQGGGKRMMRPQGGIASMQSPPSPGGRPAGPVPGQQAQPQQPSGGAGGQWLNSFIEKRRFAAGGGVPQQQAVAPQSSVSDIYQRTLENLRSGGLRGAGAQPAQQFFGGGSIPLPQSQQPQSPGLGEFHSRQQSLEPVNPYPQGQLGQGPLNQTAEGLASLGRGGDSMLMHVNKDEVNQMATSINPQTGLPEAYWQAIGAVLQGIGGGISAAGEHGEGPAVPNPAAPQKGPLAPPQDPRSKASVREDPPAGGVPGKVDHQKAPAPAVPQPAPVASPVQNPFSGREPFKEALGDRYSNYASGDKGIISIPETFRRKERRGMKPFREGGLALLDRNIPRHPRGDLR